ncbi:MAG: hypothetical protein IT204_15590 [Fimbriimonadaceae bacterium]|nr:hypothetical protein [Fimbriimonadaceae bacterium]
MKSIWQRGGLLAAGVAVLAWSAPAQAEDGQPGIVRRSLLVTLHRFQRYWKNPAAAEPVYNTWSWLPRVDLTVQGPLPDGSSMFVEFTKPDGKTWCTKQVEVESLADASSFHTTNTNWLTGDPAVEKLAITEVGTCGIQIRWKNALQGTDEVLFKGKFKVVKTAKDQNIPEFKGKQDFAVDHDWELPFSWLSFDYTQDSDLEEQYLTCSTWFKGESGEDDLQGFLFYKGKQVDKAGAVSQLLATTPGMDKGDPVWHSYEFIFLKTRWISEGGSSEGYTWHLLDKNPGDYEIKILRKGELARSIKFAVDAQGVVDNGWVKQFNLFGYRKVVPTKVLGDLDGKWNHDAWKTDAFYGNPPAGIELP